jgi:FkbM family methyltransferase
MKLRHDLAAVLPRLADADVYKFCQFYEEYAPHLAAISSGLYDRLDAGDQARFLLWFLKRWAKIDLVNGVERGLYDGTLRDVKAEERPVVSCNGKRYRLRDFTSQGYDFRLLGYDWFLGVHDILYNQYEHGRVTLAPDDVIIDAGAFIGDTAVFFHHKLGGRCQIHSFELLDENLALMVHNLERNGVREEQIVLNKLALADETGKELVIARAQQGSNSIFGADANGDRIETVTMDDYVVRMGLTRVDYIKMDIEGAEVMALTGARETIRHFEPKLAICLYHKWDDVITIPQAILSTGVNYEFAFKWVQLRDGREAVLLASPASTTSPVSGVTTAMAPSVAQSTDSLPDAMAAFCKAYIRKWGQADKLWREKQAAASTLASAGV